MPKVNDYSSKPTPDQYLQKGRVRRYAIDANFAQARAERPRFVPAQLVGGEIGYGPVVETLALPSGVWRPGFDSCPGLVKTNRL